MVAIPNPFEALLVELEARLRRVVREELDARRPPLAIAAHRRENAPEYLSADAASKIAGVRPATIRDWVARGKLARHGAGRLLRIRRDDLDRFLARASGQVPSAHDVDVARRRALGRLR